MNELDLIRTARPQDDYPDDRRAAARTRLLAGMTEPPAPQHARRGPRRISWRWQASLGFALAIGIAAAMSAASLSGTPGVRVAPRTGPAAASGATRVLLLAARSADANAAAAPAGARWIVTLDRETSTVSGTTCGGLVRSATGLAYGKIFSVLAGCPARPPAFLPQLRTVKVFTASPGSLGYPDPAGLPDQPGPLLSAIYRWVHRSPLDRLPGQPVPHVSAAYFHLEAFDVLRLMLGSGVTSPAPGVQLRALAEIPGVRIVGPSRNALGRTGIGVAISAAGEEDVEIFDAHSYQIIGGQTVTLRGGHQVTTTSQPWHAYYDATGHRL
jgi:hypothetical protein